ncbi:hypothetical protein [Nocardia cyriacigeorgica]|uniref:hypothetical protein n=1 Tax=Nocardia cyriacigeorgica TaxID=135487 RepID=UPI001892E8E1|nr:hypothetical protein [Nocardia cyriacigeorgica]MBF6412011.1 hypothetical protein [Nocardia cyriacigeorgica]
MSGTSGTQSVASAEHHYAHAAERHHRDAVYLQDGGRLPNADYHFGFAVECALKSLLLRFTSATMAPTKPGKPPAIAPWVPDPVTGKVSHVYGHLPWVSADIGLLTHGRSAARLSAVLGNLTAFDSWSVGQRYRDGTEVAESDVAKRRTVSQEILALHEQALITGRLQ